MDLSVLSWNIQGNWYFTRTSFRKIAPFLESSATDILCLQEAQKVTQNWKLLNRLREFNCVASEDPKNQNVILSKFPILKRGELAFPEFRQFGNKPLEKALWADIQVGAGTLRVYNCHFGIVGTGPATRAYQLRLVLSHSEEHLGPAVICGDFNTTIPRAGVRRKIVQMLHRESDKELIIDGKIFSEDERYPFSAIASRRGFQEVTDLTKTTWCIPPFGWEACNLKLDWFLVRGIEARNVALGSYISDHRSILVDLSLKL